MKDLDRSLAGLSAEQLELLQRRLQRLGPAGGEAPPGRIPPQPAGRDRFPLSSPQQLLWFLDRLDPGGHAAVIPIACRLSGALDPAALERALRRVVARHAILRTTFPEGEGGRPVQVVSAAATLQLPVIDLSARGGEEGEAWLRQRLAAEQRTPFDLAGGPLLRLRLFRLQETEHLLLLTVHHIVADAWSVGLLLQEVAEGYRASRQGTEPRLPDLPIQYGDFACWQQELLEGPAAEPLLAYWRARLTGVPSLLDLPTDRPRKGPANAGFGALEIALPGPRVEELRALGRRHEATLFMTLLAVYVAVLARYCESTDVFVGSPVSNRGTSSLQHAIGCFAGLVVLRTSAAGDPTFGELVERVRETCLGATAHQELPFDRVLRELPLERGSGYIPLLQAMFNLQGASLVPQLDLPGLAVALLKMEIGTVHDLDLQLVEGDGGVQGAIRYRRDLFDDETIELLAGAFSDLAAAAVDRPAARLSTLPFPAPLAERAERARQRDRKLEIAVASTFTAEPLEEPLELWMEELGLPARVRTAPYNQVFQELLDPASTLSRNRSGVNVLLLRFEDWQRRQDGSGEAAAEALRNTVDELVEALRAAAARSAAPCVVVLCPASPRALGDAGNGRLYQQLEGLLAAGAATLGGVQVIPSDELAALYPVASPHDPHADELGRVPYGLTQYAALATLVARRVHALWSRPVKVVAVDADGTLWKGVCGEDGVDGVEVDEPARALQEFLVRQHDAGVLLCVCSKNEPDDVLAVFDRHPGMVLRRQHVTAWRVDWNPKSANLRSLARDLGLDLRSFAVLDDSALERAEIRAGCPEVLCLELPEERRRIAAYLRHLWVFDRPSTTDEDRERTALYRRHGDRERLRRESLTLGDFLAALDLDVGIAPLADGEVARVAQLTHRTTQFNALGRRWSEAELRRAWSAGDLECRVVRVSDRFGDYGLVGVMAFAARAAELEVEAFLLSCRALGRGVEHRMLAHLGEVAGRRGLGTVRISCRETARNRPARLFLEGVAEGAGEGALRPTADGFLLQLPAAAAAAVAFDPGRGSAADDEDEENRSGAPVPAGESSGPLLDAALVERIARELADPEAVQALLEARRRRAGPAVAGAPVPPRTPVERRLVEVWRELLGVERVGIDDDFFKLGGHSLLGTILLSRVRDAFGVELPLQSLFDTPTVAGLARAVSMSQIEAADADLDEVLASLDELSDDEVKALLASQPE